MKKLNKDNVCFENLNLVSYSNVLPLYQTTNKEGTASVRV